jgi:hypothetical protein
MIEGGERRDVVVAERLASTSELPFLRRSALAERMNAARAEGKRLAHVCVCEQRGEPANRFPAR